MNFEVSANSENVIQIIMAGQGQAEMND